MTDQYELPKWQSHKQVWADKIIKANNHSGENDCPIDNCSHISWVLESGGIVHVSNDLAVRGGENPVGGYFVQYKDGYRSWSPAEAFEEGYTKITNEGDCRT